MSDQDELYRLRGVVENQKLELRHWRTANDLNYARMARLADCVRLCIRTLANKVPDESALITRCETALEDSGVFWSFLEPGELDKAGVDMSPTLSKRRPLRSDRYEIISEMIRDNPLTVQEIAGRLGINTGTAFNIMKIGKEHGKFEQLPSKRWRVRNA